MPLPEGGTGFAVLGFVGCTTGFPYHFSDSGLFLVDTDFFYFLFLWAEPFAV